MPPSVGVVLCLGAPPKVRQAIIPTVTVEVPRHHSEGTRPHERLQHKAMDVPEHIHSVDIESEARVLPSTPGADVFGHRVAHVPLV